ncbi:MAG: hypothetical protein K6L81_03175 [Agarilytica sp.]
MLLAYVSQLFGLSAHASMMVDSGPHSSKEEMTHISAEASLPCHGDGENMVMLHVPFHSPGHSDSIDTQSSETQNSETQNTPQSCCEADCSMIDCHTGSAALASYQVLVFLPTQVINTVAKPALRSISIPSLYRPPILG